jgi:chromate transporter
MKLSNNMVEDRPGDGTGGYAPPQTLSALFWGFFSIGARAFGGLLPWAYRALVEERRWLTPEDFAETVALCQFLPGPNIGNASIVLGRRWFGIRGALAAFLGLMAFPFFWVIGLALLYADIAGEPLARAVIGGVGAAGAGLFIGTAFKLGKPLARRPAAWVLMAGCFLAVGVARVSLLVVLPVALAFAMTMAWRGKL